MPRDGGRAIGVAVVAALVLAGCAATPDRPLWPGSKYTEAARAKALLRALAFIDHSADDAAHFRESGSDYLYCFSSIARTARDPALSAAAARMGSKCAKRWAEMYATVPAGVDADDTADLVFGWYAASELGQNDRHIKPALRRAAAHFTATDYLLFDPRYEAPPSDVPEQCPHDFVWNLRGATVCKKCGRHLDLRSRYDVWLDALITTYTGDCYGIQLGAPYEAVLRWLPVMRPYLDRRHTTDAEFIDTFYAVTHVVYTLNDYGRYLLPRDLLEDEFQFLRGNAPEAIALNDPETTGEFLDSLKSFGMNGSDEVIRAGMSYLLDTQRADGTWSRPEEKDFYTLYHSAWTGIDGLKDCRWQGEGISFPKLRRWLEELHPQHGL